MVLSSGVQPRRPTRPGGGVFQSKGLCTERFLPSTDPQSLLLVWGPVERVPRQSFSLTKRVSSFRPSWFQELKIPPGVPGLSLPYTGHSDVSSSHHLSPSLGPEDRVGSRNSEGVGRGRVTPGRVRREGVRGPLGYSSSVMVQEVCFSSDYVKLKTHVSRRYRGTPRSSSIILDPVPSSDHVEGPPTSCTEDLRVGGEGFMDDSLSGTRHPKHRDSVVPEYAKGR